MPGTPKVFIYEAVTRSFPDKINKIAVIINADKEIFFSLSEARILFPGFRNSDFRAVYFASLGMANWQIIIFNSFLDPFCTIAHKNIA